MLVLESFGAEFPRFFADETVKVIRAKFARDRGHILTFLGMVCLQSATRSMVWFFDQWTYCRPARPKAEYHGPERGLFAGLRPADWCPERGYVSLHRDTPALSDHA